MFVIKYDKVSMIKLVKSIEKYPALYDTTKHYSKDEQDKSWDRVALEVGEKDSLCREKWHSIKSCYVRHLKYTALNTRRRPYYLAEYLDFMQPFVSSRVRSYLDHQKTCEVELLPTYLKEALPLPKTHWKYSQSKQKKTKETSCKGKTKVEVESGESASESDMLIIDEDYEQPSSSKSSSIRPSSSKQMHVVKKIKTLNTSPDEDVEFFKSLLSEVGRMSSHQKLKFKQETLSIIEDILYASEEVNVSS